MASVSEVLANRARWAVECGDAIEWWCSLPDDSVDMSVGSPPYEKAREYGELNFKLKGEAWVGWMLDIVRAAAPKVKGPIFINCEGQTNKFRYSCTPSLLEADLHRRGFNVRKAFCYQRPCGIPGGGGHAKQHSEAGGSADWVRNDWEYILCITRPGKLPYAHTLANGHAPKCKLGGAMSNRTADGRRKNERGNPKGSLPRKIFRSEKGGHARDICEIANPGNVIRLKAGGGHLGHDLAHENEAPYPVELPKYLIRAFCPPNGVVADCFLGSGTTLQAALELGCRGIGCDIRESQCDLTRRRMATVTACLPGMATA